MFGLPLFTVAVLLAVAGFWIIYTLVFLVISRNWHLADELPIPAESGSEGNINECCIAVSHPLFRGDGGHRGVDDPAVVDKHRGLPASRTVLGACGDGAAPAVLLNVRVHVPWCGVAWVHTGVFRHVVRAGRLGRRHHEPVYPGAPHAQTFAAAGIAHVD